MIHHHEYWWRFFPKKELTQVYASAAIRSFAVSLIGLFIPLYLFNDRGYSLEQTLSFFIFYSIIFAISTPFAAKFSARFGVKHSVLLSIPLYLLFIGLLYSLPIYDFPLMIVSATLGLSQSFYWMGMHLVFHHASHHKHRGEEIGKNKSLNVVASMFGPLIGGLLIKFTGFKILFCIASLVLFSSGLFLFLSKDNHVKYHFSLRTLVNKKHWQDSLFFVSRGTAVIANGVIWPLFIFGILGDYLSLGLVGFILSGTSVILFWLVGRYSDHVGKRKVIRWITGFESLSWFLKAMVLTVNHVFAATIFGALTMGVKESPLGALEYDKAKGEIACYFVSREVFICLGRILLLMVVIMSDSLTGGLVFQGFANFASLLF